MAAEGKEMKRNHQIVKKEGTDGMHQSTRRNKHMGIMGIQCEAPVR